MLQLTSLPNVLCGQDILITDLLSYWYSMCKYSYRKSYLCQTRTLSAEVDFGSDNVNILGSENCWMWKLPRCILPCADKTLYFAKFSKCVFLYNPYLTNLFYLVSKDFSWKSFAKQFFGVHQNTLSNFSCRFRQSKHSIQR